MCRCRWGNFLIVFLDFKVDLCNTHVSRLKVRLCERCLLFLFCCYLSCLHCRLMGWMYGTEARSAAHAMNLRICKSVNMFNLNWLSEPHSVKVKVLWSARFPCLPLPSFFPIFDPSRSNVDFLSRGKLPWWDRAVGRLVGCVAWSWRRAESILIVKNR